MDWCVFSSAKVYKIVEAAELTVAETDSNGINDIIKETQGSRSNVVTYGSGSRDSNSSRRMLRQRS